MLQLQFIPKAEFDRVREAIPGDAGLRLLADMCRVNALSAVKLAGSGHLGSSFSAMDIVVWLYHRRINAEAVKSLDANRDIYFSSKGHDVPGLYSVLAAVGILPMPALRTLRRYGGLDGHPNLGVPGIEANSGSLGMGISKGRGFAWAKRLQKKGGHVYVLIGDGELQEGQNYEALQTTAQQQVANLTVIVDHNKLQTDRPVDQITSLRDLEARLRAFGWYVARCDGHDFSAVAAAFTELEEITDRPKVLIADTIKGRGVSFMEHPRALAENGGIYKWHAGAPDDRSYASARDELVARIDRRLAEAGLAQLSTEIEQLATGQPAPPREYVANAFGEALLELATAREDIVVLDGDLAADCRVREFELRYPDRFIENGIAEQDMVSMAGGLARSGLLPIVNSFVSFLSSRANEQIYNNATEESKIIYACHYAGLIPAGPGKSHQSIRDISLFSALPNCLVIQPCNGGETRDALRFCVDGTDLNCALRLAIGPSPRLIQLPGDYQLALGRGVRVRDGADAIIFSYGPIMLHEAMLASELLEERGFGLAVVNMPWLNRVDEAWFFATISNFSRVYVLEDHAPIGGLGDLLARTLATGEETSRVRLEIIGVAGFPACGTPAEALAHHGMSGADIADRINAGVYTVGAHYDRAYTVEAPQ